MADNRYRVMAVGDFKESTVDCPVQLKKYQIIYDLIADKTYLRVVLENFSSQKIVGVFLNVDCLDIFEKKFAEVAKVSVKVECNKKFSEFGKECPFAIPTGTKSVKAYIVRVVFSDMTVWENRDLTFVAPVSDLKPYTAIKEKNQLEKELAKRNYNAKYLPVRYENCWRCTCGHLNGNLNDVCSACRSRASILFNIFDDKNLEICKKEDTYNEARKFDTSKDYLQASKLYSTILDYKDSKVLFAKALENSKEAIYNSALDTLKTAQKEENFDSAIKSLSSISEYKDAKTQIDKAKEQKNEFIYNQALERVKKDNVGKNDFDKSISDMQRIPSYKDSSEKIKEIDAQKRAFLDKKEHARKMKKVRNISIVACVIAAIIIAILIPFFVEPNLYTKETTYEEITIGNQSGYCLERYNENEDKVVIPSEYLGKPVLKIGERAFQGKSIKEITIPESVRKIGYNAFADCRSLNAVYYSNIEKWYQISFENSTANPLYYAHNLYLNGELLTDLTIPEGVAVDQYAFVGCNTLQNITAGSVVASTIAKSCQSPSFNVIITNGNKIDEDAFRDCKGLKNITLPADVTSIGYEAFRNCNSLENIYFNGDIAKWCVISGLGNLMYSARTLHIGDKKVEGDLVIPDGVKSISNSAFAYCNGLTSVTVPASVLHIWDDAFVGCRNLTNITAFADNASAIAKQIISKQFSVTITGGTSIAARAFENCGNLVGITISNDMKMIGTAAFHNCTGLTSIVIPDSVTSIESEAFVGCSNLANVTLSNTLTNIGPYVFKDCSSLTSIAIPDEVQSIDKYTFFGCTNLANVTIGNNVTNIGDYAFSNGSSLTCITIPDSVMSIGYGVFSGCSSLESITIPFVGAKAGVTSSDTYQYPFGYIFGEDSYTGSVATVQSYYGSSTSSTTSNTYYIPSSLKSVNLIGGNILYGAFYNCSGLANITIPDSVINIDDYAFSGCSSLTSLSIPDNITSIGAYAFRNCNGLTSITIPDSVKNIGSYAFYDCSGLMSVAIGNGVTSIGSDAFYDCSGLTSVRIPANVTSIGGSAFYGCSKLQDIYITDIVAWCNVSGLSNLMNYGSNNKQLYLNDGLVTSVTIPDGVTEIPSSAFRSFTGLTTVTIGNSVTSIGSNAFSDCVGLTRITGSSNATSVIAKQCGASTFEVVITSGTSIGNSAFYNCNGLTSITIPNSVKNIGDYAFSGCNSLTNIIIPDSVTSIGDYAFSNTAWYNNQPDGLVCAGKVAYKYKGTMPSNTSIVIKEGTISINSYAFSDCSGLTSIIIPDSVTRIGYGVFSGCSSLESITIPFVGAKAGVTSSDTYQYPFGYIFGTSSYTGGVAAKQYYYGNSTSSTTYSTYYIPSSLKSVIVTGGNILYGAFYDCSGLTSISIPDNITSIGVSAFRNCSGLTNIAIPNSVTSIGSNAFSDCSGLMSVRIPASVISIGDSAFSGCSKLQDAYITDVAAWCNISGLSNLMNYGSNNKQLYLNDELVTLVTIPDGVTEIPSSAFRSFTGLTIVTIGNSVTSIVSSAFENCTGLTSIVIPGSVTSIGYGVFSGCSSLESITIPFVGAKACVTSSDTYQYPFGYIFGTSSYTGSVATEQYYYGSSTSSTTYSTYYIPSSLKSVTVTGGNILYGAFYNCNGLTSVAIPDSVTSIGNFAFNNCSGLTSVTIGNSVMSIGDNAFNGCSGLTSITIPDSVTSIGNSAFRGCSGLTNITIPNGVTSIGSSAFLNCSGLTSIVIPESVTSIGSDAFQWCRGLTSIVIPDSVTSIGSDAFNGCSGLTSITIPDSVTSIGNAAFYGCSSLTSITLPFVGASVTANNGYDQVFGYIFGYTTTSSSSSTVSGATYQYTEQYWDHRYEYRYYYYYIPSSIKSVIITGENIPSSAFLNCSGLTSITISDSVTAIGLGAFKGCSGLVNITLPFVGASKTASAGYDQVFGYIFDYTTSSNSSLVNQYSGTSGSYYFYYYYYIPKTIKSVTVTKQTTIPKYAFNKCDFIASITIPQNVTKIGSYAFADCKKLKTLNSKVEGEFNIPQSVTAINQYAFNNCLLAAKVTLPDNVTSIDDYAFAGCSKISQFNSDKEGELVVPSSCSAIGSYAFSNLVLITDINVPDSVTTIGCGAFKACSGLVNITLPFVGTSKTASAGYDQVFGYIFDYTTSSNSSLVNQYSGTSGSYYFYYYYYIPKTIKSVTVTKQTTIPKYAFNKCDFIESITIPQNVTKIGSYAFADCKKLKTLNSKVEGEFNIPQSVTAINQYAFNNCLLATKVILSGNVTSIGDYAFAGCSLLSKFNSDKEGELVVPSSCSNIGSYAFNNLVLITDINVPDSVTAIGLGAFKGCSGLVNITLPFVGASKTASAGYDQVFGYIFDYTTSSNSSLVNQYSGTSGSYYFYYYYYIPKTIKSVTVTKQTTIPKYAFNKCDFIASITIPQNVTKIGSYAFADCKKLKTLNSKVEGEFNIPQSVTTINRYAFNNCLLAAKVTLPDNVTSIDDYAFAGCSKISQFNSSNQGELFVPKNCEIIGASAFAELKLIEKVCVGDIVYRIGAAAFSKMISLKEIILPFVGSSNVSSNNTYQYPLGYVFGTSSYTGGTATTQYFYGSSISSVTSENYYIPTTLQKVTITLGDLNYGAFYNCSNITEVIVSQDAVVNEKALYACSATITRIDYTATNYSWNGRDTATAYNSGDGSEANPYIISNGDELAFFAQQVNIGQSYEGVYFKLSQNIYMANKAFEVIGNDISYFKGVFDGNGFAIKSVSITSTAQNVGLFGKTSATIKNLRLLSTTINSNSTENQSTAGLLVGHLLEGGTVSNCSAQGTITAKCQLTLYCGGLIGYNDGSVDDSSASVNVSATSTSLMVYAGGLIGYNNGDVINSTANGTVSASGYNSEYTHKGNIFGFNSKA